MTTGPYDVIVLWRRESTSTAWSLAQVFHRDAHGTVTVRHHDSPPYFRDGPDGDFAYLWERHLDGRSGNGQSYEFDVLSSPDLTDIDRLLEEISAPPAPHTHPGQQAPTAAPASTTTVAHRPRPHMTSDAAEHSSPWADMSTRRRLHRRAGPPNWLNHTTDSERSELHRTWGEDPNWGWSLPWLWSALSSPRTLLRAPATPTPRSTDVEAGAYWTPALHLMLYGLGWRRPDQGLAAWITQGLPRDNPALVLLDEIWARDGQLDWLAAWLARTTLSGPQLSQDTPAASPTAIDWNGHRPWIDRMQSQADVSGIPSPIASSHDPLHLRRHCRGPREEGDPGTIRFVEGPRPVVVADQGRGWYQAVSALEPAGKSIEVVNLTWGTLGSFTQSTSTGFVHLANVRADWHLAGN